jgi:hypothetical protein
MLHASMSKARRIRFRRVKFWIRRYLPPEIVGTVAMLVAANVTAGFTASTPVIALSALVAESIGFYAVMGVTVYREQWAIWGRDARPRLLTVIPGTARLLLAEFGATELVDLVLVRPAILFGGILLTGNSTGGLVAGKIVADLIFYALAAIAFTVTLRLGLREVPAGRSPKLRLMPQSTRPPLGVRRGV